MLYQSFLGVSFKHKTHILCCYPLVRKHSYAEAELQKPKNKISTFSDFSRTMGFDGLGFGFILAGGAAYLLGTSIMATVVLGSGSLLGSRSLLHKCQINVSLDVIVLTMSHF